MDFLSDMSEIFEEVELLIEYLHIRNKTRGSSKSNDKNFSSGLPTIPPSKGASSKGLNGTEKSKQKKSMPPCLNLSCSEKHLVNKCSKTVDVYPLTS